MHERVLAGLRGALAVRRAAFLICQYTRLKLRERSFFDTVFPAIKVDKPEPPQGPLDQLLDGLPSSPRGEHFVGYGLTVNSSPVEPT